LRAVPQTLRRPLRVLQGGPPSARVPRLVQPQEVEWLPVAEGPDEQTAEGTEVLPVFPLHVVEWPGSEVNLNIIEPAYRRMYNDILLSGSRKFLMPFAPCVPGQPRGRVRFPELAPEDRRLHAVGAVLYLEDLSEVSSQTGDMVKYQAQHTVVGRARMKRLLNPSALFKINEDGWKVEYLRAEVEYIDEDTELPLEDNDMAASLVDAWDELRLQSERVEEPHIPSAQRVRSCLINSTTWQIAESWQQLQLALRAHRERAQAISRIQEWIRARQRDGELPEDLPERLDIAQLGLPRNLLEALATSQDPSLLELGADYWEPLLQVQAASNSSARRELLLEAALEEARVVRARAALRAALR